MRSVQRAALIAVAGQAAVLLAVSWAVGLDGAGWMVGLACGVSTALLLARALARRGTRPGPADWVTLSRMTLVGGVAALAASPGAPTAAVVCLSVVALALDGVDGQVARRTGTASDLGARFDMEVDAFLILVLSVVAAQDVGWWVLAVGAARYVFVMASWLAPWLARPLPYRYWRKVVAATQGVALVVVVSGVPSRAASTAIMVVALALLAESFGRDVLWLWRRRLVPPADPAHAGADPVPAARVGD